MALKYFNNEASQSVIIQVESIDNSPTWVNIDLYRSEDRDNLELTKQEALQLRDALSEFLNE
jgi:hypothetical protein